MDEILLSVLPLGVSGAVGSTYNFAAPLYVELVKAFEDGDFEKARSLQLKSVQIVRCLASYGFMPAAKSAMAMIGVDCGICRPPARNLSETQKQSLRSDLENLGFFDWQSR